MSKTIQWPITVEVTQADIDRGEENDCRRCPVALAIARAVGPMVAPSVEVHHFAAYVAGRDVALPDRVADWITNFDCNGPESVKPFSFTLEGP